MRGVSITKDELSRIDADIARQHKLKKYRPVVVAMVRDKTGRFLLVQSAKGALHWGFPQGGVNPKEKAIKALTRELFEETGITASEVIVKAFCHVDQIIIPGMKRDGFTEGKRYFYFYLERLRGDNIVLNPEELLLHKLVLPKEAIAALSDCDESRKRKSNSMLTAFASICAG